MIKRIVGVSLLFFLIIALGIKLVDPSITQVSIGTPFLSFLTTCSMELEDYKFEIPYIPTITSVNKGATITINNVWDAIRFAYFQVINSNVIITILNGFVGLINGLITIINVIISLIQFIIIVVNNLISFKDELIDNPIS